MKRFSFVLLRPAFAAAALAASAAAGAPLTGTTAVQTQPAADAPVIGYLKAGTEPVLADAPTPEGWLAVTMTGPFEAYVQSGDLNKNLDVRLGAPLYREPKTDAAVLAVAGAGDKIEITGLRGKWTQVELQKNLTGYIHAGPLPPAAPPAAANGPLTPVPAAPATAYATDAPALSPAPAPLPNGPGHAVDANAVESGPRILEGKFVPAHRPLLGAKPPYDWELVDPAGTRLAYVDAGKLLLTEQIDKYVGHEVEISGGVQLLPGGKDLVIIAESLTIR